MEEIIEKLKHKGIDLADPAKPGGSYIPINVRGNIAWVAIQFPVQKGQFLYPGRFGNERSTAEGYEAAKIAAGNILAQIHKYVGFGNVAGLNHMDIYYQAYGEWDEGRKIADGASDLMVEVLGEKGQHSRAIFGVERLSRNCCVAVTSSFTLV